MLELTIPFDTLLEDAARRKQAKYQDLVASVQEAGTHSEAGHCGGGVPNATALLGLTNKVTKDLMARACGQAIRGSYGIWCMRNLVEPPQTLIRTVVSVLCCFMLLYRCGTIYYCALCSSHT